MGVANCQSVRNKAPMISDVVFNHSLDILSLVETHIRPTDTDCLLQSITPPSYKLCQRPRAHGSGGGVHSATHLHGHTLDLILTSDSSLVSNVVVSDYISDHAMIECQVETPTTAKSQANRVTYRRYHKINMDTLRNDLSNCSFVACPGDTAKKLYDQYTNDLSNLLDKHAPEVTRCLAKEPAKWLSDTYKNASGVKRKLLLTVQSCANKLPGVIHLPIKTKPHITELLLMKTVMTLKNYGKFCVLPYIVSLTRFCHQIVHKKLAEQFATFFTNKIAKIRESFSSSSSFSLPSPVNPPGLVKFDDVSPDDIAKVVKNSPTKSCLLDPWPTFLVKDCLDILLPSITKLVNCVVGRCCPRWLQKCCCHSTDKEIFFIKDELKNYRPVSGLSFISKLVERVVASQLSRHVSLHGLEKEYKSAYRRGHSTETALLSIKNQIHLSLARGEATAVVLLDQSAAFDTIDNDKLLDCLRKWFGVGSRCLDWFKSYLSDRTQCIKIGSFLSEARKLKFGVPQGQFLVLFFFRCIPHL